MVPYAIKHSGLINFIIHVFAEQKVDNWVQANYPDVKTEALAYMDDYEECMPLFKRVMLKDSAYVGFTEQDLDLAFDKFIQEIKTSQTGYDTAFESKSFMTNFKALPLSLIVIYTFIMSYFGIICLILAYAFITRRAKLRHYIAVFFFLPIFLLMLVMFIANASGMAFTTFIHIIKPISNYVPIGNTAEYYVNLGIENTQQFFIQGQRFLDGTEPSGYEALTNADRLVLPLDIIGLIILIAGTTLWSWYLVKGLTKKTKKVERRSLV
jgi:hypothetical protein